MYKYDGPGAVEGRFVSKDVATGRPPSMVTAVWCNRITDELLGLCDALGITPDADNNAQLGPALIAALHQLSAAYAAADVALHTQMSTAYAAADAALKTQVWHPDNDGAGSGLDADTLDGQHASYFLPASAPVVQNVRLSAETLTGYVNGYDATVNYTAPAGAVLTGQISVHNNSTEDRRFSFHYRYLQKQVGGTWYTIQSL